MICRVCVQCGEWIVQEVEIHVAVDSSSDGDALLLPAGQVNPVLSDQRHVSLGQLGKVRLQGTGRHHLRTT